MLRVVRPGGRVVCLEISHPPGKIFGTLFHFYFYRFAPLFGTIIGKAFEEYNYLPHSLTSFPDAPALKAIMEEVGWSDVRFYRLTRGIVAVHGRLRREDEQTVDHLVGAEFGRQHRDVISVSAVKICARRQHPGCVGHDLGVLLVDAPQKSADRAVFYMQGARCFFHGVALGFEQRCVARQEGRRIGLRHLQIAPQRLEVIAARVGQIDIL